MNLTKVHLFVVLLLALVLCSFFGGDCGGNGLEGFMNSPYHGNGQYSDRYSSYAGMYSDAKSSAKTQDALNDRKNKPLPPSNPSNSSPMRRAKFPSPTILICSSAVGVSCIVVNKLWLRKKIIPINKQNVIQGDFLENAIVLEAERIELGLMVQRSG